MKKFLQKLPTLKPLSDRNTMFCFSPPVMVATFMIELLLAIVLIIRNYKSRFSRAVALVLLLLALFQISEYIICTTSNASVLWARIGMAAVSLLPPMGIYLVSLISRKSHFLKLSSSLGVGFFLYFLFVPKSLAQPICGGNYVILNVPGGVYWLYAVYYIGFLLLGTWEAWGNMKELRGRSRTKRMLKWLIAAYTSFMLPTAIVYIIYPISPYAIASVMCGFALLMALILVFKIVPLYNVKHEEKMGTRPFFF